MAAPTAAQKLDFLRRLPAMGTAGPTIIETHFAWVILGRRTVFKLKKPLRHGRMDYRSLAQRRRGCRAELVLNRRASPDVYQCVLPISVARSGELRLGRSARTVDWLVQMKRLPAQCMMDAILAHRPLSRTERC